MLAVIGTGAGAGAAIGTGAGAPLVVADTEAPRAACITSSFSRLCATSMTRPSSQTPFISALARSALDWLLNVTKPNPRDTPVALSNHTREVSSPNFENATLRPLSSVVRDKPPTHSRPGPSFLLPLQLHPRGLLLTLPPPKLLPPLLLPMPLPRPPRPPPLPLLLIPPLRVGGGGARANVPAPVAAPAL